ncbi:MAG TPA: ABC transporter substrate-binding protein [Acidimicrobiales bacterium]|nr:ABC transporter substrate-binding protein [Acidimicrobiales bacterium]
MHKWNRTTSLVLVAVLALIAACGGDDAGPAATGDADATTTAADGSDVGFPVTVTDDRGEEVTVAARPERIVSLSATATEVLFAIGAGDQVEAVDDTSNFPEEAPTTGISGFDPNVEAIADLDPDLVVIFFDPGDMAESLELLGIPVLLHDAVDDLDGAYAQIAQLGEVTGNIDGAAAVVADMRERIEDIVADLPEGAEGLTYFHELDDTLYTATSDTFVGHVYGLLGLENVADAADDGSSYPQLSAEYLVEADPDLIFLADAAFGVTAESVAERPGFSEITAVREGNVIELDEDISSRWGPRIVEFLEAVAAAVERVPTGAGA